MSALDSRLPSWTAAFLRVTTKLDFDPHTYEPDGPETSLPMNLGSGAGVSALGAKATWIGLHPP